MAEQHPLFAKLEPEAEHGLNPEHAMLASIAVSLKRIADAVAGTDTHGSLLGLIADRMPSQ